MSMAWRKRVTVLFLERAAGIRPEHPAPDAFVVGPPEKIS
jgi:hypothetical protein